MPERIAFLNNAWLRPTRIAVAVALCYAGPSAAQVAGVSGVVRESGSGTPVVGAQVQVADRRLRATTDAEGRFVLEGVPSGNHTLRVARIGFRVTVLEFRFDPSEQLELSVQLAPLVLRLADIVVAPGHFGVMDGDVVAQQTLTREDIETIPQVGEDIFRAIKRLPGIASDDISTRLNVRGGTDQELLVLIDGMELYEPYHLKDFDGVMGIVDVNSIGGIDLATGGFPVEYGDKLVGVFDMRSRTPPPSGVRTTLGLSITNASFMSQGAFDGGNGQWLLSARRGYLDIALALTGGNDNLSPQYFDVFGKTQYQLSQNHRLSVQVLHANDDLTFREQDGDEDLEVKSGWQSSYGWLTWDAQPSSSIHARTMGFGGRVTRRRVGDSEELDRIRGPFRVTVDDDRVFEFVGVKEDISIELSDRVLLKVGGEFKHGTANYDYFNTAENWIVTPTGQLGTRADTVDIALEPTGDEISGYVATRVRPIDRLTAEVGVRYDRITHTDDEDLAPRFHAAFELTPRTTIRGSWGRYYQSHGLHELEVGDGQEVFFGSDLAEQIAIGVEHRFESDVRVRVELYRRTMDDQRPRFLSADRELDAFPETEGDRIRIDPARGKAQGFEFRVSRDEGRRWAWSASYVLAEAVDEIDGAWVPRTLDQRHTVGLNVAYRPNNFWHLTWGWQYHTGWPATASTFAIDSLADGSLQLRRDLGPYNALRLPAYHRMDFRVTRNFSVGRGVLQAYLDIFNMYNRTNLRSYGYGVRVNNGVVTVRQRSGEELLPILPSLGFRWEF